MKKKQEIKENLNTVFIFIDRNLYFIKLKFIFLINLRLSKHLKLSHP
jgi:hypothetical protein